MSNPTSNFGWQMPTNTDLVSQLPADFEVFGQAVDTSLADLKGGTTGQILAKNTDTDMDFVWETPSGGDFTKITELSLSTASDFNFTSIPSTYRNLVLMGNARSSFSGNTGIGLLRFNSDSSTNYDWVNRPSGVGPAGTEFAGVSYIAPFQTVAATATTNNSFSFVININNYKGTTFFKEVNGYSTAMYNTTAANFITNIMGAQWRSTSAITSIQLSDASGGNFIAGSVCTLYGVN